MNATRPLSTTGGDRATAYTMSNKLISLGHSYLATWIDKDCQNQFAMVDTGTGEVTLRGPIGKPGVDNHCGAALARTAGVVHAITGGHHSPLHHYRMALERPGAWHHVATLPVKGTYPSVVADADGHLSLAYRSMTDVWTLDCSRRITVSASP